MNDAQSVAYYEGALQAHERECAALAQAFASFGDGRAVLFRALLQDYENVLAENARLEQVTTNLGIRLAEAEAECTRHKER